MKQKPDQTTAEHKWPVQTKASPMSQWFRIFFQIALAYFKIIIWLIIN